MKQLLLISLALFSLGCASNSTTKSNSGIAETEVNELGIKVISRPSYQHGEMVIMSVENQVDTLRYIFQPTHLNIQKRIGDSTWKDLQVIDCPCGAPCAPPRYQELIPYEQLDLHWDQRESWCDNSEPEISKQMKTAEVTPGVYRMVIVTNDSEEKDQTDDKLIKVEFRIRN